MDIKRVFLYTPGYNGRPYLGPERDGYARAGFSCGGLGKLVEALEPGLGIFAPWPSAGRTAARAMKCVREYIALHPGVFFAASFAVDPFSSTQTLLEWKDALLEGGGDGDASKLPERPGQAMAALDGVEGGFPMRARRLLGAAAKSGVKPLESVRLLRPRESETVLVQSIFAALEKNGVRFAPFTAPAGKAGGSDLAKALVKLRDGADFTPSGDGTLTVLSGETPYACAEALCSAFLDKGTGDTVIIAGPALRKDLDAAMARFSIPPVGSAGASVNVSALQVLPLYLDLLFSPQDPGRLVEYLTLPFAPLPRRYGRAMAEVVSSRPGMNGPKWNEKLEKLKESDKTEAAGMSGEKDKERALKRFGQFMEWLPVARVSWDGALETAVIAAACGRARQWAVKYAEWVKMELEKNDGPVPSDVLKDRLGSLQALSAQASALEEMLGESGLASIGRIQLSRMVGLASSSGTTAGGNRAQAGSVACVDRPGAVLAEARTVIWWDFTASGDTAGERQVFGKTEREQLSALGIRTGDPGVAAVDSAVERLRPFSAASERLVLVCPSYEPGGETENHSAWDELSAGWDRKKIEPLILKTEIYLKGRSKRYPTVVPELPSGHWELENVRAAAMDNESPSSLETLVSCPLRYVFQYQAGLGLPGVISPVSPDITRGNLAHRALQQVLLAGAFPASAGEASRKARSEFDAALPEEGTVFLAPVEKPALDKMRKAVASAAGALWELMNAGGLKGKGVEAWLAGDFRGVHVEGRADALVEDGNGKEMVLEIKYPSRGDRKYEEMLSGNKALQPALYSALKGSAPVSYFIVGTGRSLTDPANPFPGSDPVEGADLGAVLEKLAASLGPIMNGWLAKKQVPVAGDYYNGKGGPAKPHFTGENGLEIEPSCGYCDYRFICGAGGADEGAEE